MKGLRSALSLSFLASALGCADADTREQTARFCDSLAAVNRGGVDTTDHPELQGHVLVMDVLLAQSPPSLVDDLTRIRDTVDAWSKAVSGEQTMLATFDLLSAPELIGSEGRVTDYAAEHCGVDLGGPQWVEADRPTAGERCPAWPRIGTPLTFNHFPNLPDIAARTTSRRTS